jgi:hypothetical protein
MNRELSAEFRKRFPTVTEKESYAWSWRIPLTISKRLQEETIQVTDCADMAQRANTTSDVPAVVAADDDGGWSYSEPCEDELFHEWFLN